MESTGLSLVWKGAFIGDLPCEEGEWENRVDVSSPHSLMVWKSHFSLLLIKCVAYASHKQCLLSNLKSVMWGVGAYPVKWWQGALRTFYKKAGRKRIVTFRPLREWVVQGKRWQRVLPTT